MKIIPCGDEHIEELVAFIVRLNDEPSNHIAFFGVGEADVRSALDECVIPISEGFRLANENEKLIGIFGVDADPEISRAWLLGPIIEHAQWQKIADELFSTILPMIPEGIREQEIFCDVNNTHVRSFAEKHHFPPRAETAIFSLDRKTYIKQSASSNIIDFQESYFAPFETLHNELFPNTYYTARQIVEKIDDQHRLLLAVEGERLLGYHFCKIESESGYVDFIGMDSSARGRGIGASLLASGLDWMFASPTTARVNLTVNADNDSAQNLYKKFGFVCERITIGFRKTVNV
ncbi:MAG TPA: GNAT family N-acetyltransferase [Anaerolineales bacterium]|mgnify:CR=1 FL=1|nr:hypothetical protein [Anaerolineae bacterium]HRJ54707.1 GNAT family N-acetyltransferase [Anaerolineales bacterium]HRK90471.1 GNAT family N-acetyltransferase [Anaerolineales bacterium]